MALLFKLLANPLEIKHSSHAEDWEFPYKNICGPTALLFFQ